MGAARRRDDDDDDIEVGTVKLSLKDPVGVAAHLKIQLILLAVVYADNPARSVIEVHTHTML